MNGNPERRRPRRQCRQNDGAPNRVGRVSIPDASLGGNGMPPYKCYFRGGSNDLSYYVEVVQR